MLKELKNNLFPYLFLVIILFLGFGSFLWAGFDHTLQFQIAVLTLVAYVFWGLIYHLAKGDLYLKVVVEYVLIAALVLVLLWAVILRA